jgi:hypothetical protein
MKKLLAYTLILGVSVACGQTHIEGNCNAVGNNNTVCSWSRAEFSDALGQQLLARMPDKKKPVALITVGGNKDQAVGTQVQKFLSEHGYTVQREITGIQAPPPDEPFTLQVNGNQYQLMVAPSAH